jgi:hypothetical protein
MYIFTMLVVKLLAPVLIRSIWHLEQLHI